MQRSFSKNDVTGLGFQSPVLAAEWAGARRGGQADRHKKALARCPSFRGLRPRQGRLISGHLESTVGRTHFPLDWMEVLERGGLRNNSSDSGLGNIGPAG